MIIDMTLGKTEREIGIKLSLVEEVMLLKDIERPNCFISNGDALVSGLTFHYDCDTVSVTTNDNSSIIFDCDVARGNVTYSLDNNAFIFQDNI